jgi:adenylate cyclase, class 2
MGKGTETEIKLEAGDPVSARKRLEEHGFVVRVPRLFESNIILDKEPRELRPNGKLLRLRQAGDRCTITYKGPATVGKHKSREECELDCASIEDAEVLFDRLGYIAMFRYEKYRTEYHHPGEGGYVTLDETPIGCYYELEGDEAWIDRIAAEMGFQETHYITTSYATLYVRWCEARGEAPTNLVFSATA